MKILIAEDDFTSRMMLEAVLEEWGYETVSVGDGRAAWEVLRGEKPPQVALLDWEMPELKGVEVCRRAKALVRSVPLYVILLTIRGSKEDILEGFDCGADDYVTKPFDNRELQARIRAAQKMLGIQESLAKKVRELADALEHIKTLQGILPICMHCHKIRNDDQAWERLEAYIQDHSEARFSHSICPECLKKYYPDMPNFDK